MASRECVQAGVEKEVLKQPEELHSCPLFPTEHIEIHVM